MPIVIGCCSLIIFIFNVFFSLLWTVKPTHWFRCYIRSNAIKAYWAWSWFGHIWYDIAEFYFIWFHGPKNQQCCACRMQNAYGDSNHQTPTKWGKTSKISAAEINTNIYISFCGNNVSSNEALFCGHAGWVSDDILYLCETINDIYLRSDCAYVKIIGQLRTHILFCWFPIFMDSMFLSLPFPFSIFYHRKFFVFVSLSSKHCVLL